MGAQVNQQVSLDAFIRYEHMYSGCNITVLIVCTEHHNLQRAYHTLFSIFSGGEEFQVCNLCDTYSFIDPGPRYG